MKSFFLFVILLSLWLLMSGHYSFLIISLGVISCVFCVYLAKRANLIDDEGLPLFFLPRLINYLLWLFKEIFKNKLIKKDFRFDVMSTSKKNVLRGLHIQIQKPQAKIITVVEGKIMDVAVDLRKNSKTFGKYYSIIISDKSEFSFFIVWSFTSFFNFRISS